MMMSERRDETYRQQKKILLADQLLLTTCIGRIANVASKVSLRSLYREDPTGSRQIETGEYGPIVTSLDERLIGSYVLPFSAGQLVSLAFRQRREITTEILPTTTSELVKVRSGVHVTSFDAPQKEFDYSSLALTLYSLGGEIVSSRITPVPRRGIHAATLEQTQLLGYTMAAMEALQAQGL